MKEKKKMIYMHIFWSAQVTNSFFFMTVFDLHLVSYRSEICFLGVSMGSLHGYSFDLYVLSVCL